MIAGILGAKTEDTCECENCAVGFYQSKVGQTQCLRCVPGYFCPPAYAVAPVPLLAGTYSSKSGLFMAMQAEEQRRPLPNAQC